MNHNDFIADIGGVGQRDARVTGHRRDLAPSDNNLRSPPSSEPRRGLTISPETSLFPPKPAGSNTIRSLPTSTRFAPPCSCERV
jgi:hypothetical protein